ncbi:MAG: hypothetical protein HQL24_05990 [Candidatus Omnitrophica bacterium]|nr:hypothetical protein [Candidatus Omnitrophota bacterium]
MILGREKSYKSKTYKLINILILLSFILNSVLPAQLSFAQTLPAPIVQEFGLTPAFNPAVIKGIKIFPDNPLRFDFIVDTAQSGLKDEAFKQESTKLIKYFLASLTTPEDDMWVNLNPKEPDRIIPEKFGVTEMGRDLLAQDYLLKQITSSLMNPEKEIGKTFWDKIYKKSYELYGTTDVPVDTLNKVWIIPAKAVVYEHENKAFVVEAKLKVMLEEDYLASTNIVGAGFPRPEDKGRGNRAPTQIIKEIIIPELEKEVNVGKSFAPLRQIYYSMILATWFKRNLKESLLGKSYVDQNKTAGVDIKDKQEKLKIYDRYLEAFKKGAYNFIKEEYDPVTQSLIPRKYFSGGMRGLKLTDLAMVTELSDEQAREFAFLTETDHLREVVTDLFKIGQASVLARQSGRQRRPRIESRGIIVHSSSDEIPMEDNSVKFEQQDLPVLYWEIISKSAQAMVESALQGMEEIKQGKITEEKLWIRLNRIWKKSVTKLADEALAQTQDQVTKKGIKETRDKIIQNIDSNPGQLDYAYAMAAFGGEQTRNNGNGEYQNVSFPRDMGLLYTSEMSSALWTGEKRTPNLFYISGANGTFNKYYHQMGIIISHANNGARNFDDFLAILETKIKEWMEKDIFFKAKIEEIQDELRAMGVDQLKQVRFVDSGYRTFPPMFCAILHMMNPEIKVKALFQETDLQLAEELNVSQWSQNVRSVFQNDMYAKPTLRWSENDNYLRHPFKADGDGTMRPTSETEQLQAYWGQLCFVIGTIKYQFLLNSLNQDLKAQGKSNQEAQTIGHNVVEEALDVVHVSENSGDSVMMPTMVKKGIPQEFLKENPFSTSPFKKTLSMDWLAKQGLKDLLLILSPMLPYFAHMAPAQQIQERPSLVLLENGKTKVVSENQVGEKEISHREVASVDESFLQAGWVEPSEAIKAIQEKYNITLSAGTIEKLTELINSKHKGVDARVIETHNKQFMDAAMTTSTEQPSIRTRRPPIEPQGVIADNTITFEQQDLPVLYSPKFAEDILKAAMQSAQEVKQGKITEQERWQMINTLWKESVNKLADDAISKATNHFMRDDINNMRAQLIQEIEKGPEQLDYAFAMSAFGGEQTINNGKGEYQNVTFPRDMGLLYTSEKAVSFLSGEERIPNLFYISGENATFSPFYYDVADAIMEANRYSSHNFDKFLSRLKSNIKDMMKKDPAFKAKIEEIQDELRAMGIDKLKKVRFVDSGFKTFPPLFCAILQMMNPEIDVKGLFQFTSLDPKLLPQLDKREWRENVRNAIIRSPAVRYAVADLSLTENMEFLNHPFEAGKDGIMHPTSPVKQLKAYAMSQLAMVIGSIKYQDLVDSLNQDLKQQGKPIEHKIIQEALDILQVNGNVADTVVMPTMVKKGIPKEFLLKEMPFVISAFKKTSSLNRLMSTAFKNMIFILSPMLPYFAHMSSTEQVQDRPSLVFLENGKTKVVNETMNIEEQSSVSGSFLEAGWVAPDQVIQSLQEKYGVTLSAGTIEKLTDLINSKHKGIDARVIEAHNKQLADAAMTTQQRQPRRGIVVRAEGADAKSTITFEQRDLQDLYFGIISETTKKITEIATQGMREVEQGIITEEECWERIRQAWKDGVNSLADDAVARSSDPKMQWKIDDMRDQLLQSIDSGSRQQDYGFAMSAWNGEEMIYNGNGDYENVSFPRDMGLLYTSEMGLSLLTGQKRSPNLFYISGSNGTFEEYYSWMCDVISQGGKYYPAKNFNEFLSWLEIKIKEHMKENKGFKAKIEEIQNELRVLGVDKLKQVRFVDSGYRTFPPMFCAILHMMNPRIKVKGLFQESQLRQEILPGLDKTKWRQKVRDTIENSTSDQYAQPSATQAENDSLLKHPFFADDDGTMKPTPEHEQLRAYWTQLSFVIGAIKYQSLLKSINKDLKDQGKSEAEVQAITQNAIEEALEIVHVDGKTVDSSVMPTLVEKVVPEETLPEWAQTAVMTSQQTLRLMEWIGKKIGRKRLFFALSPILPFLIKDNNPVSVSEPNAIVLMKDSTGKEIRTPLRPGHENPAESMNGYLLKPGWLDPDTVIKVIQKRHNITFSDGTIVKLTELINSKHQSVDMPVIEKHNQKVAGDKAMTTHERRPPIESRGIIVENPRTQNKPVSFEQQDLPVLYWDNISEIATKMMEEATRSMEEVKQGKIMEKERRKRIKQIWKDGLDKLIQDALAAAPSDELQSVQEMLYKKRKELIRKMDLSFNFGQPEYGFAMAAFIGEQTLSNDNEEYENVFFARDAGLFYTSEKALSFLRDQKRSPGIFYISGRNATFESYYALMRANIAGFSKQNLEFDEFLSHLESYIKDMMRSSEQFRKTIEGVQDELRTMGIDKLKKVRFIDTGYVTFPPMFCAILHMMNPEIKVKGLVLKSYLSPEILPQLDKSQWRKKVSKRLRWSRYAWASAIRSEKEKGFLKHPFSAQEDGIMRPVDPADQLQAYWTQLAMVFGAIKYQDFLNSLDTDLQGQGKQKTAGHAIVSESLDMVKDQAMTVMENDLLSGQKSLDSLLKAAPDYTNSLKPAEDQEGIIGGSPDGTTREKYVDAKGQVWLFKAYPRHRLHRAMVDEIAYKTSMALGLTDGMGAFAGKINGRFGAFVQWKDNHGSLWSEVRKYDEDFPAHLGKEALIRILREQVLDWLISQHDSHAGGFLKLDNGAIFPIDKSQAFKYIGASDERLSTDYNPNEEFNGSHNVAYMPVYNLILKAIAQGKVKDLTLAEAWDAIQETLKHVEEMNTDEYVNMLKPYAIFRFDVIKNGESLPNSEKFLKLARARKENIVEDFKMLYFKRLGLKLNAKDAAMMGDGKITENADPTKGGIDLNPKNLTIESKGGKVQFNANVNLEELKSAPGFEPVIINVIPVTNVYQLLGLAEPKKSTGA